MPPVSQRPPVLDIDLTRPASGAPDEIDLTHQAGRSPRPDTSVDYTLPETLMRQPYVFLRNLIAGAPGLPIDLANVARTLYYLPTSGLQTPGTPFGGGSEDIQRAMDRGFGEPPGDQSGLDRISGLAGTFASPGLALRALRGLGLAPEALQTLEGMLSAGAKGDIAMGGAAGLAGQAARYAFPESPSAQAVGEMAGPIGIAGGHRLLSAALPRMGEGIRLRQDAAAAQERAQSYGDILRQEQGRASQAVEQAGERSRFATAGAESAAAARGEDVERARAALTAARQGQEATFTGLPTTLPSGASPQAAGRQAQAASTASGARAQQEARAGTEKMIAQVGPRLDRFKTLARFREYTQKTFQAARDTAGSLFDATEAVTKDEPVVPIAQWRQVLNDELGASRQAGVPTPAGATHMQRTVGGSEAPPTAQEMSRELQPRMRGNEFDLPEGALRQLLPGLLPSLDPAQRHMAERFLAGDQALDKIPFWLARRMESALGRIAFQGGRPIGTMTQGTAKRLYFALHEHGFQPFFATEEGQQVAPELAKAKDLYRDFVQTYNKSIVGKLLDDRPAVREKVLNVFTSAGKDIAPLLDLRKHADPETWSMLKAHTLSTLYQEAAASGEHFTQALSSRIQALRKSEKWATIFSPEDTALVDKNIQELTSADATYRVNFRKALAKKAPEDVPAFAFAPGKVTNTEHFRDVTTPEAFDMNVKAWASQLANDMRDMTPAQIHTRLKSMDPYQLEIMFAQYPGVADRLKGMVSAYRTAGEGVARAEAGAQTATERLALAQEGVATTRRIGKETVDVVKEAAERPIGYAQADYDRAQETLRAAKAEARIPEDMHIYGRTHVGGITLRSAPLVGLTLGILDSVVRGQPLSHAAAGLALGGATVGAIEGWHAWANTARGQQAIRYGLPTKYGPAAARFAIQSLHQETQGDAANQ